MSINIKKLQFNYDEKLLFKNLNLNVEEGKFYSIIGPNGSGKSTLVKNILNLVKKHSGEIKIDGINIDNIKLNDYAKLVSYVPQISNIDFDFTLRQIVEMGRNPYIKRFYDLRETDNKIVEEMIKKTGIEDIQEKSISKVSGGELQRAYVARSLAQDTKYIILDEPVNHLDISHQISILNNLKSLTGNKTVITVLHDLNLALNYSDEIILMDKGEILFIGNKESLIATNLIESTYKLKFEIFKKDDNKIYIFPKL